MRYENLLVTIADHVAHVQFNRPEKANALHAKAFEELRDVFETLDLADYVRVIILSGNGKHFSAGIDLDLLSALINNDTPGCDARTREQLRRQILKLQISVSAVENCSKPIIAAITGACVGAGVDIVCACDVRYGTNDCYLSVKEIDMGIVADLGTLQRLPKIVHQGFAREIAFTGRNVYGPEAEKHGLLNKSFATNDLLMNTALETARQIASKSPVSIRGTKHILNYSRDHSVQDGLSYVATWNAAMLLSDDLESTLKAKKGGIEPIFKN
jgi:enoyl-CoA hydratase